MSVGYIKDGALVTCATKDDLAAAQAALQAQIDQLQQDISSHATSIDSLETRATSLGTSVSDLQTRVTALEQS